MMEWLGWGKTNHYTFVYFSVRQKIAYFLPFLYSAQITDFLLFLTHIHQHTCIYTHTNMHSAPSHMCTHTCTHTFSEWHQPIELPLIMEIFSKYAVQYVTHQQPHGNWTLITSNLNLWLMAAKWPAWLWTGSPIRMTLGFHPSLYPA